MNTVELLAYLKTVIPCDSAWFGAAKMDGAKDRALCLYHGRKTAANKIAVGGDEATGYRREPMTLLIRWTKNAMQAERKAREIYAALKYRAFIINGRKGFLQALYDAAAALGTDERGVYEYSVDFNIYYEEI